VRTGVRRLLGIAGSSVRRRTSLPPGWTLRGAKTGTAQVRGGDDAWLVGVLRDPAARDLAFAMVIEGVEGTSLATTPGVLAAVVRGVPGASLTR
jgi:beta-lactamase class D